MYFNNKREDTNIDSEFKGGKKNIDLGKYKLPIIIAGGILLLAIIIGVIVHAVSNRTKYFIQLYGDEAMTIYVGTEYVEQGYVGTDNKKNNLTSEVVVDSNLNTSTVGEYTIVYKLHNTKKVRTINVVEKPTGYTTIYLKGNLTVYLKIGEAYTEEGYTVIDTVDSDLTDKVKITNNINNAKEGTYQIVYSVTNSSGVTTSETRTVIVSK